jgi:tetratricopeptide (TPR) repeat protein
MGLFYQVGSEYGQALYEFFESRKICENNQIDRRVLSDCYHGIGVLYFYDGSFFDLTLEYFKKSLRLRKKIGDQNAISVSYYSLGEVLRAKAAKEGKSDYRLARKYFSKALELSSKFKNRYVEANVYQGMADIFIKIGEQAKAHNHYQKSLDRFIKIGDQYQLADAHHKIGNSYSESNDYEKAEEHLTKAFNIAKKIDNPYTLSRVSKALADVFKKLDKIYEMDSYNTEAQKYEAYLKKGKMFKFPSFYGFDIKMERVKAEKNFLVVVFFLTLLLALVAFVSFLVKRNDNRKLAKQKIDIEMLSKIGQDIVTSLEPKEIVDKVYENVNKLMDADVFSIDVYNEKLERLESEGAKEEGEELPFCFFYLAEDNCLTVKCFKTQKVIRFNDYRKEYQKYITAIQETKAGRHFNSHVFLPLTIEGKKGEGEENKRIGVITV